MLKTLDETVKIDDTDIGLLTADVAELADAQASGACGLRPVEVRLLSSAMKNPAARPQDSRPQTSNLRLNTQNSKGGSIRLLTIQTRRPRFGAATCRVS